MLNCHLTGGKVFVKIVMNMDNDINDILKQVVDKASNAGRDYAIRTFFTAFPKRFTLQEVGKAFGLSRARICQIVKDKEAGL